MSDFFSDVVFNAAGQAILGLGKTQDQKTQHLDEAIGQLTDGKILGFKMTMVFTNPTQVEKIVDIVSIWNYIKEDDNARIILHQQPDRRGSVVRCNVENGVFKSVAEAEVRRMAKQYFMLGFGAFQYKFFEYIE